MISRQVEILNAVFTPMRPDGAVDYDRVPALFNQFLETGSHGIFLNGTTGECMSLSTGERTRLVESWVAARSAAGSNAKLIVHVGDTNLYEAAEMARHAEDQGANGIAMVASYYFRPRSLDDLLDQCAFVAQASPNLPFYYYNIPSLTGVSFSLLDFVRLAPARIPNFAGLKNSFNDLVDYQQALHAVQGRYSMYWGTDETFLMLYAGGNRHYVGSTYNYMHSYYRRMLNAFDKGDVNTQNLIQREADQIYSVLSAHNGIVTGKEIMKLIGCDCGPVRVPLQKFSQAERDIVLQKLKGTTFFGNIVSREKIPI